MSMDPPVISGGVYRRGFYKKTRKGKVVKVLQERYLRSDIQCGFLHGNALSAGGLQQEVQQAPHKHLLVLDTNVALQQIDALEWNCPATSLMVFPQTMLQELKHLNLSVYRRAVAILKDTTRSAIFFPNEVAAATIVLRQSGESANDANDRAIVAAAAFLDAQLHGQGSVVFLTADAANRVRRDVAFRLFISFA